MSKDRIIELLQDLVEQLRKELAEQKKENAEQKEQNSQLLARVDELLARIASLEEALLKKSEEAEKEKKAKKGLSKLLRNESEQQKVATVEPKPHPKTNNGARRKDDYELEVEEIVVNPTDPDFDISKARLYQTHDVIRYVMIPMKFKKIVYHCNIYSQDGSIMEGKAPLAPLQNSLFDGSFIAGIAQLRYIYSMPVERIIHLFNENGFDLQKPTAHGLLRKTAMLFENLHKAMRDAVLSDSYIGMDETYKNVLVAVGYMQTEWDALVNIFSAGDYELDNNLIERQNRYISLSRRNSLFFGSHTGAERGVIFYSLACSCRLHNINFFEYISDIINQAAALPPNTKPETYRKLLPDMWKKSAL